MQKHGEMSINTTERKQCSRIKKNSFQKMQDGISVGKPAVVGTILTELKKKAWLSPKMLTKLSKALSAHFVIMLLQVFIKYE